MSTTLCAAEPLKNQAVKLSISHPFEARLWYSAVRNTHAALLDSIALIYEALRLYYIWTCKWVSIYCVLCFVHRVRMKVSSHYVFGGLDKDHHVLFLCVSKWSACNILYIHNHVKLLKTQNHRWCFFFFCILCDSCSLVGVHCLLWYNYYIFELNGKKHPHDSNQRHRFECADAFLHLVS